MLNHIQNDLFREDSNLWPTQVAWDERNVEQTTAGAQGQIPTPDFDKDLKEARTVLQKLRNDYASSAADSSVEKIEKMERYVRELEGLKREYDKTKTPEVTSKLAELKRTLPQDFASKLQSAQADEKKDTKERPTGSYEQGKSYTIRTNAGGNINVRRNGSNFPAFSEFKNGTSVEVTNDALQVIHNQGLDKYRFILVKGTDAKGKKVEGLIATAYLDNGQGGFGEGRPTKGKGGGTGGRRSAEGGAGAKAELPKDENVVEADKTKVPYESMKWLQDELFKKGIVSKFWEGGEENQKYFNLSLQAGGRKFKIYGKVGEENVTLMEEKEGGLKVDTDTKQLYKIINALPHEKGKEALVDVATSRLDNVKKVISYDQDGQTDLYVHYEEGGTAKYKKFWKKKGDERWGEDSLTPEQFQGAQANEKNPGWKVESVKSISKKVIEPGITDEDRKDPNGMYHSMRWIREDLLQNGRIPAKLSKENAAGTDYFFMRITTGGKYFQLRGAAAKGSTQVSLTETTDSNFNKSKDDGVQMIAGVNQLDTLTNAIREAAKPKPVDPNALTEKEKNTTVYKELDYLKGELKNLGIDSSSIGTALNADDKLAFRLSLGSRNFEVGGKRGGEQVVLHEEGTSGNLITSTNKDDLYKILDKVKEIKKGTSVDLSTPEKRLSDAKERIKKEPDGIYLGEQDAGSGTHEYIFLKKVSGRYVVNTYQYTSTTRPTESTQSYTKGNELAAFLKRQGMSPMSNAEGWTTVAITGTDKAVFWKGDDMESLGVRSIEQTNPVSPTPPVVPPVSVQEKQGETPDQIVEKHKTLILNELNGQSFKLPLTVDSVSYSSISGTTITFKDTSSELRLGDTRDTYDIFGLKDKSEVKSGPIVDALNKLLSVK